MDLKPLKVLNTVFSTNDNRQPETSSQQAKQIYKYTFKDMLTDLLMEQQEQM